MYVEHIDSKRRSWVFNIPYGREQAAILSRFLWDLSALGKVESMVNPAEMITNAGLRDTTERVILSALSQQYPATVEEYTAAQADEKYIL